MLGRGAMGEVYLANDTDTKRQIALKLVYKGPHAEDQEIVDAERLGAELQKRLSGADRHVVNVTRYGEINGNLFIEMDYIEGEDLAAVLDRGPTQPGFAVHVVRELCEMLENLRTFTTTIGDQQFVGIIHGDLKPRNIRLNPQNQVKVVDFGIAKALSNTRRYTVNVFASTAYCSPERLETQNMDSQSDLWSVGVLLYQMLAGKLPFEGENKERLERRIRSSDPPSPLPAECPEPLGRITLKMLARDPQQRYQTAAEVKDDLERYQKGQTVLADNDATVRTGPLTDDATVRTTAPLPPRPPIPRRNSARGLAAVAGFCLVGTIFTATQINFSSEAGKLKSDLETERLTNLDEAWTRYQDLMKRTHMGALTWGVKSALKKRLVNAADGVISEYRDRDAPTIFKPQWMQARTELGHALEIDPGDNAVKGRLRLCEGHIQRIESSGLNGLQKQKYLNDAVAEFNEAAELLKHSPDPYLGLARLYVYEMNDLDKGEEALSQAAKHGHPMGKRELALLADGYRRRADREWRESRSFSSTPSQEREYLDQAKRDYIHAEDLYQQVGLFGDAARNETQAIQGQQRVEQRLIALQGAPIAQ